MPIRAPRGSALVGFLAAVVVAGFVLTSSLVALMPQFQFESQFPALLPFLLWAAAIGVGHVAPLARSVLAPWRGAFGYLSLVPYGVLMLTTAAAPHLDLPWWSAAAAAGSASLPFLLMAVRPSTRLAVEPLAEADETSVRGTFFISLAVMLMAYSVAGDWVTGAVLSVLLAVALGVVSMMTNGLAHASRTWRLRHWVALTWGTLVIWACVLVQGLTHWFSNSWLVFLAVVIAGVPLVLANHQAPEKHVEPAVPAE